MLQSMKDFPRKTNKFIPEYPYSQEYQEYRRMVMTKIANNPVEEITVETLDGRYKDNLGQVFCVEAVWTLDRNERGGWHGKMNILPWEKV